MDPEPLVREAPARVAAERDLYRRLLELGEQDEVEGFLRDALALLVESVGAHQGYLELTDPSAAKDESRAWTAHACSRQEVEAIREQVSRGIVSDALSSGRTVRTASALADPRFRTRDSVQLHGIEAVVCAPIGGTPPFGVAYLQGRTGRGAFSDEDVARLEFVARHLTPLAERLLLRRRGEEGPDPTADIRRSFRCETLVGRSRALAKVLREAAMVAPLDVNVLVTGESGTGKTEIARLIHRNSPRASGPMVSLNCAAIPTNLVEQELFGAEPGAHSTAAVRIVGKVEAADGGVLFLDEIGDLPAEAQAKLLELVQEKTYYPLGSVRPQHADVRVIAATNVDLEAAVREKKFRPDLYWRLATLPIRMPSLAERPGDVPLIARHLVEQFAARHHRPQLQLGDGALMAVWTASWPGNVRELANRLEGAVIRAIHANSPEVARRHVFPEREDPTGLETAAPTWHEAIQRFQRQLLLDTLAATNWNVVEAARRLDLARSSLYNLIQAHGLKRS